MSSSELMGLRLIAKGLPSGRIKPDEASRLVAEFEAMAAEIRRLKLLVVTLQAKPGADGPAKIESKEPVPIRQPLKITFEATCPKCKANYATPGGKPAGSYCQVCPEDPPGVLIWEPARA